MRMKRTTLLVLSLTLLSGCQSLPGDFPVPITIRLSTDPYDRRISPTAEESRVFIAAEGLTPQSFGNVFDRNPSTVQELNLACANCFRGQYLSLFRKDEHGVVREYKITPDMFLDVGSARDFDFPLKDQDRIVVQPSLQHFSAAAILRDCGRSDISNAMIVAHSTEAQPYQDVALAGQRKGRFILLLAWSYLKPRGHLNMWEIRGIHYSNGRNEDLMGEAEYDHPPTLTDFSNLCQTVRSTWKDEKIPQWNFLQFQSDGQPAAHLQISPRTN